MYTFADFSDHQVAHRQLTEVRPQAKKSEMEKALEDALATLKPTMLLNRKWTVTLGLAKTASRYVWVQMWTPESQYKSLVRIDHVRKIDKGEGRPFRYQVLGQNFYDQPYFAQLSSSYFELTHISAIEQTSEPAFITDLRRLDENKEGTAEKVSATL